MKVLRRGDEFEDGILSQGLSQVCPNPPDRNKIPKDPKKTRAFVRIIAQSVKKAEDLKRSISMEGIEKISSLPFIRGDPSKGEKEAGVLEKRGTDPGLREHLEDRPVFPTPGDPCLHLLEDEILSLSQVLQTFDLDDQGLSPPWGNGIGTVDDPDIGSKKTGPPLPVRPGDQNRLGLVFQNVWVKLEENLEVAFEGGFKGGFADILGSSKNARQKTVVLRDLPNGHWSPWIEGIVKKIRTVPDSRVLSSDYKETPLGKS